MGSFSTGFCVGLGLGLLFTPMKGEEMRHLIGERLRYLRGTPPANKELSQSVSQMGVRLQEVQNRAEPARPMGATTPDASPVQQTASSTGETQLDLNRAAQQVGVTPPTASPVQQTASSTEEVQQELNRAARQTGSTTPGTVQETVSSSTEEAQRELNRAAQQMGATTPGTVQETTSSPEEVQQNLNRAARQAGMGNPPPQRRPRGSADTAETG